MIKVTDLNFWMENYLYQNLNTVLYNMKKDWDFVFIITGNGMVRVGKSVLGQQIAYYVAYQMQTPFSEYNVVFSGEELMEKAKKAAPNSVFIYDEARGELDSKKTLEKVSKILQDFFAECGTYNHFIILILPDFFELNRNLAINRSEALIDVFRGKSIVKYKDTQAVKYERGYFKFYNRKAKKFLYINGKKNNNSYDYGKPNFKGRFLDFWTIDKDLYQVKKINFLKRNRYSGGQSQTPKYINALKALTSVVSQRKASELLKQNGLTISHARINQLINDKSGESHIQS